MSTYYTPVTDVVNFDQTDVAAHLNVLNDAVIAGFANVQVAIDSPAQVVISGGASWNASANPVTVEKTPQGLVRVTGRVVHSAGVAVVLCTLPAGYRPAANLYAFSSTYSRQVSDAFYAALIKIATTGDVTFEQLITGTAGLSITPSASDEIHFNTHFWTF